ncbi:MAG: hypothetical protein OEW18_09925, partial [Candidatus Aminicenantes bacterium]|nr:hypothetical protein [Candidatus Aminicenantes bacterium]
RPSTAEGLLLMTISLLFFFSGTPGRDAVRVAGDKKAATIENSMIKVEFDLTTGRFSAADKRSGTVCISEAVAELGVLSTATEGFEHTWRVEPVEDALGQGKTLRIMSQKEGMPSLLLEIILYEDKGFIVLGAGLDNQTGYPVLLRTIRPLLGRAFSGRDLSAGLKMLDGNSGGEPTLVSSENSLRCRNNLLVTFGKGAARRSLVMGGLSYADYEKFAAVARHNSPDHLEVDLWSFDPVGKQVEPGARYLPLDKFYLDFTTADPFVALEAYGQALRAAQNIRLNPYTFPSVCLWYVSVKEYGGGPAINDSTGAVWEIEQAALRGFLKYTPVAIRLVPDNYDVNNEQGWWDDAHFQALGEPETIIGPHYKPPYETTQKWGRAVREQGGIPLLYFQTARRSEDYCRAFPGHLLFNNPFVRFTRHPEGREIWWYGEGLPLWGYDFTDPDFLAHMREVYANLKSGSLAGLMYDYPSTGWAFNGGFEDKQATTASAYRNIFKVAREGLGEECFLHERNLGRGSDVTLGLVASQRVWGDTDRINPAMLTRCGLRWYKNRVVVSYDMDAKNPFHCRPDNRDGWRAMFTMAYVASGRMLLGASFSRMTDVQIQDLSRTFPYHTAPRSARPVDAFSGAELPQVYDFEVNPDWHQVTFLNTTYDSTEWRKAKDGSKLEPLGNPVASAVGVNLGEEKAEGGLGLDPNKKYYVYDFWNGRLAGVYPGNDRLEQDLRPGEARMMSIHAVEAYPQFISTSRHIMQGFEDMVRCDWDGRSAELSGTSKVIGGERYRVVIALNGYKPEEANSASAKASIRVIDEKTGLAELTLDRPQNGDTDWTIRFSK